eukprot:4348080-Alexandrium_andersonii.AAC.1
MCGLGDEDCHRSLPGARQTVCCPLATIADRSSRITGCLTLLPLGLVSTLTLILCRHAPEAEQQSEGPEQEDSAVDVP